jgi:uncharacterized small protein (DUF1192 family)
MTEERWNECTNHHEHEWEEQVATLKAEVERLKAHTWQQERAASTGRKEERMKNCPNPECSGSEDSLEIVEDERCTRNRCCWVHCDWCGVAGPTAGPSDESAIEAWDRLPRITEENYVALKDEFNRGAALAHQHCPKAPLGHSVFEGIPLLAAEVERLKAEVELLNETTKRIPELTWRASQHIGVCGVLKEPRGADIVGRVESIAMEWHELRAHTWQQERAAVVKWLWTGRDGYYAEAIDRGEHWPTGEES